MGRKKKRDAYEVLCECINNIRERFANMPSKEWSIVTKYAWDSIPNEYRVGMKGPDDIWKNPLLTLYLGWADLWEIPGVTWEVLDEKRSISPLIKPVFDPKIYY